MKILLDHCVDWRLRRFLPGHDVKTTDEMGWGALKNGALLDEAQKQFEVLLTVDRNIQYQQNLKGRSIAVVILRGVDNRLATLAPLIPKVEVLLLTAQSGEFYEIGP